MSATNQGLLLMLAFLVPCVLGAIMTKGRRRYPLFPSLIFWFGGYQIVWGGLLHPLIENDPQYPQHPAAAVRSGIFLMLIAAPWLYRARRAYHRAHRH